MTTQVTIHDNRIDRVAALLNPNRPWVLVIDRKWNRIAGHYATKASALRRKRQIEADFSKRERPGIDWDDDETEAKALAATTKNPIEDPDNWINDQPVYGSPAWDGEAEYELASFEADAYGEPRPQW